MKRKPMQEHAAARSPADAEDEVPDASRVREPITRRGDGFYWEAPDGRQEFGPFETYELAWADMHSFDPDDIEPGESLSEAEAELGLSDWIDPDTGGLSEGLTSPHIRD
jgi:hypothetical protein